MDEDWVIYSATSFTFVVIFAFCYIRHILTFFERNKIQHVSTPSFPFGNVYDVVSQRTPMFMQLWKFHNKLKRKDSAIGGFYVFTKPVLLVVKSEEVQAILSTNKSSSFDDLSLSPSDCLNNIDKELSEKLQERIFKSVDRMWSKVLPQEDDEVNITNIMNKLVGVTVQELFGGTLEWPETKFAKLGKQNFVSLLREFLCINHPQLKKMFSRNGEYDVFNKLVKDNLAENLLEVLTQKHLSHEEKVDFLQSVIYELKTVNNLMLFILFELSINEEIQDELRHELTKFKKTEAACKEFITLPYLEAVIAESLRKYPSQPFIGKISKTDYCNGNVHMPSGTPLFVSVFGIHHDKQNYTDPEIFDPDRFFEENLKFIKSEKYIPFGCRDENSFGCKFMKLMMKMVLAGLILKFKFSLGKKSPKQLDFDASCFESLKLKKDIFLKVHKL